MIITHFLLCLVSFTGIGQILSGCQGRDMHGANIVQQSPSSKSLDETKTEIKQKNSAKSRRRKRRSRTTEAPESSNDTSSPDTEESDADDIQSHAGKQTESPLPPVVRPVAPKANKMRITPEKPSTTARAANPPPPPPIENLFGDGQPKPAFPKFPISPDELLSGKGKLRKMDPKPTRMKRKPRIPAAEKNPSDVEPSSVDVD